MRTLIIISIFLFSNNLFAQGESPSLPLNFFNIRIAPLALIDLYSGSCYKLGVEFKVKGKTSMTLEGGKYFKNFNGLKNVKGQIIDIGIRHYIDHNIRNQGYYLSLNYSYKEEAFDFADSIMANPPYHQWYHTEKFIHCINLNFGKCTFMAGRIIFDIYGGLGVRFKKVNSSLTTEELEMGKAYSDSSSLPLMVKPGQFVWPNVNFGIRVGFVIK